MASPFLVAGHCGRRSGGLADPRPQAYWSGSVGGSWGGPCRHSPPCRTRLHLRRPRRLRAREPSAPGRRNRRPGGNVQGRSARANGVDQANSSAMRCALSGAGSKRFIGAARSGLSGLPGRRAVVLLLSHPRPWRPGASASPPMTCCFAWALEDSNLRPQPCEGCAKGL